MKKGLLLLPVLACSNLVAGIPLLVSHGQIAKWKANSVISYEVDQGPLGSFSNSDATNLVNTAFRVWQSVPTCNLTVVNGGSIGYDVSSSTWGTFQGQRDNDPDLSPIVFDNDGSITELYYGTGASKSILGFAGPIHMTDRVDGVEITAGWAVLNGKLTNQTEAIRNQLWRDTLVHEFGHFLNLSHSPANLPLGQDSDLSNNVTIPIMSPVAWLRPQGWNGTTADDVAIISSLYPKGNFKTVTGTVSGRITLSDGTPFKGAHVAAIRLDANQKATSEVYSGISGFLDADSTQPDKKGYFEIGGLPAGQYAIYVEGLDSRYSWVVTGPELPGPAEFFNATETGATDPDQFSVVTVGSGQTVNNLNLALDSGPSYRYLSYLPLSINKDGWNPTLGILNLSSKAGAASIEFHNPDGTIGGLTNSSLTASGLSLLRDANKKLTGKSGVNGYILVRATQPISSWISLATSTGDPQILNGLSMDTSSTNPIQGVGNRLMIPFATKMGDWKTHVAILNLGATATVSVSYVGENGATLANNTYTINKGSMIYLQDIVSALPNTDGYLTINSNDPESKLLVNGLVTSADKFGGVLNPVLLP